MFYLVGKPKGGGEQMTFEAFQERKSFPRMPKHKRDRLFAGGWYWRRWYYPMPVSLMLSAGNVPKVLQYGKSCGFMVGRCLWSGGGLGFPKRVKRPFHGIEQADSKM